MCRGGGGKEMRLGQAGWTLVWQLQCACSHALYKLCSSCILGAVGIVFGPSFLFLRKGASADLKVPRCCWHLLPVHGCGHFGYRNNSIHPCKNGKWKELLQWFVNSRTDHLFSFMYTYLFFVNEGTLQYTEMKCTWNNWKNVYRMLTMARLLCLIPWPVHFNWHVSHFSCLKQKPCCSVMYQDG